jgi:hypothetical protein
MACEPADAFYQKEISRNGPEVLGLEDIARDLLEPRFCIVSGLPTTQELIDSVDRAAFIVTNLN